MATVLVVQSDACQRRVFRAALAADGSAVAEAADGRTAFDLVKRCAADLVVIGQKLPDMDGLELARRLRETTAAAAEVPIVMVGGERPGSPAEMAETGLTVWLELPLDARQLTAVVRGFLHSQERAARLREARRAADQRYHALLEHARDAISILDGNGIILEVNRRFAEILGIPRHRMIGRHLTEFAPPGFADSNAASYQRTFLAGSGRETCPIRRADGSLVWMVFSNAVVPIGGETLSFCVGRDVTAEVQAEEALRASESKYRCLLESVPGVVWSCDSSGRLTFVSHKAMDVCGFTPEELRLAGTEGWLGRIHPEEALAVRDAFAVLMERGKELDVEYRFRTRDGRWIWLHSRAQVVSEPGGSSHIDGFFTDVTERKRLREQLLQAQKMEAIGQLTGGVAHDFNNLLAVMISSADFLLAELASNDPRRSDAEEIKLAGQRAAALTRQLLAFSRRQVLQPTAVNLDAVVSGLGKMLRRLIGEDIELVHVPAPELGTVRADIGQLEQVIMNLAVNARDAMPTGGRLTFQTANVEVTAADLGHRYPMPTGPYVMLSLADTGCGMDAAVQSRIFEPFFTTKEKGKGTGLGLSTSYGIIKQSGGFIWVYSEVGRGTVFKIYLPRVDEAAEPAVRRPPAEHLTGSETVLLVEDDDKVRAAAQRILEANGYRVLAAATGQEALELFEGNGSSIQLLLSDVVIPRPSGPELAMLLRTRHLGLKVLFVSGYADHAVMEDGLADLRAGFMQKPFGPESLARKVREVLDS